MLVCKLLYTQRSKSAVFNIVHDELNWYQKLLLGKKNICIIIWTYNDEQY